MNKCICEWCNHVQDRSGRGYCRRHYDQMRKYGKILDIRTRRDNNRIITHDDYAEVVITDGKDNELCRALISNEDINKISRHRWTLNDNGYIRTFKNTKPVYLHRYLADCPDGLEVDHINHNKLDNRRDNLRVVTRKINALNKIAKCYTYIGDRKLAKPWCVRIIKDGKPCLFKYFATEREAQEAVKAKRKEIAML